MSDPGKGFIWPYGGLHKGKPISVMDDRYFRRMLIFMTASPDAFLENPDYPRDPHSLDDPLVPWWTAELRLACIDAMIVEGARRTPPILAPTPDEVSAYKKRDEDSIAWHVRYMGRSYELKRMGVEIYHQFRADEDDVEFLGLFIPPAIDTPELRAKINEHLADGKRGGTGETR